MSSKDVSFSTSSDIFRSLLLQMASTIIWKNATLANQYEKNTDPYFVENFMCAKRGLLNFDVIGSFDEELLRSMGIKEPEIYPIMVDKYKMPVSRRDEAVKLYCDRLIAKNPYTGHYTYYEEENNYYRMLSGLPDVGDTKYVYVTKINSSWPTNVPVHEMNISQRMEMEQTGYLDELIVMYPEKKYLNYLGKRCIDIFNARAAERFDILYCESDNATFEGDFREIYNQNKYVINAVYFSDAYRKSNDLYENFLAMSILFMTLQQMNYKYLEKDVTRDFYDIESLRYIYESYGVPFFSEIPLEYHTRIVKQMNRLMSYKGSSTVFFDLFDLFDSGAMDIYSYYITKTHRMDEYGMPIFVKNEDGTPNYPAMYDIKFSKVKLGNDPSLEVSDPANAVGYYDLVNTDPYWVNDKELLDKLYESDFNYTESKYIGIQTVLDVLSSTYQNAYFFKMLQDNKTNMRKLSVKWNATNSYVTIFDLFLYGAALYCKKYEYSGELSDDLAFTATVLGYDFKNHVKNLQTLILSDTTLSADSELVKLVRTMNTNSLTSVNNTFMAINNLREYLCEKFSSTHDKKEYQTYRNLYNTLLTSQNMRESFTKDDGMMATSYNDMLASTNPELYTRLLATTAEEVDDEIRLVIMQFEKSIPAIKTLSSIFGLDVNALIDSLFKILNFFKSAKAELVGYDIIYMMSLRGVNFFKFLDHIYFISDYIDYIPEDIRYTDIMQIIRDTIRHYHEILTCKDIMVDEYHLIKIKDYLKYLRDDLKFMILYVNEHYKDRAEFNDFIIAIYTESVLKDMIKGGDNLLVMKEEFLEPKYHGIIKDEFQKLTDDIMQVLRPGDILPKYNTILSVQDIFLHAIEKVQDDTMVLNSEPLFPKDRLIFLSWVLIGSDDYLHFITREMHREINSYAPCSRLIEEDALLIRFIQAILKDTHLLIDKIIAVDEESIQKSLLVLFDGISISELVEGYRSKLISFTDKLMSYLDKALLILGLSHIRISDTLEKSTNISESPDKLALGDEFIATIHQRGTDRMKDMTIIYDELRQYIRGYLNKNENIIDYTIHLIDSIHNLQISGESPHTKFMLRDSLKEIIVE